jgi:hypothetical protein
MGNDNMAIGDAGGVSDGVTTGTGTATGAGVSAGGASGASGQVGVGAASQETATKGFEGSIKQASDVNAEEVISFLQNLLAVNAKRTYDIAQTTDLKVQEGSADFRDSIRNLTTQALQNSIETANMVAKQAVRHSDIAIDRQWNVDEQGFTVSEILRDEVFVNAVAAAAAKAAQG